MVQIGNVDLPVKVAEQIVKGVDASKFNTTIAICCAITATIELDVTRE